MAVVALLAIVRLPHAWTHGRFLDEEGSIFFAYAWHRPGLGALFRSFGGYLNLGANATTALLAELVRGGIVPLERAPYVTMTVALAFQLLPAVLLLTGRAPWLTRRWAVLASLLLPVVTPMTEEVFANVLHIQFHLALAAALVLALEVPARPAARVAYAAVLFLAPLCGPGAIVLLPFFALRALVERDRGRLGQFLVFAAATALQLLLFFRASPVRGKLLDPVTLAAMMFDRLIVLPLSRPQIANRVGRWIFRSWETGHVLLWLAALLAAIAFTALIVIALRRPRDAAAWLIVPALAIAAASFGGGMIVSDPADLFSVGAGERYNFLPLVMLGLGLVALATRPGGRWRRTTTTLVAVVLVAGAAAFTRSVDELRRGPDWPAEVARWRRDHAYPLTVWPNAWTMDLSDGDRPCHPPTAAAIGLADPSYCESAWLARVARHMPNIRAEPAASAPTANMR